MRSTVAKLSDLADDELAAELVRLILSACDVELEIQNRRRRQAGLADISVFPPLDRKPRSVVADHLAGFGRDINPIREAIAKAVEPPVGADG